MAFQKKRILFFLFASLVLGASPALSVPLSSGVENPGAAAYGTSSYTDPDGETAVPVDGTADRAEARIVDHRVAMSSASEEAAPYPEMGMGGQSSTDMGRSTPGWILPAAAVGAGGGALFALMSHDKGGDGLGSPGSGGGITSLGTNNGTPGDNVPEPGTILLVGAGIASFLSRRRILSM
jgi:hypothetical protein